MFLLFMTNSIPGVGPNSAQILQSIAKTTEPSAFEKAASSLSDLNLDQAKITLEMLGITNGQTLFDLAKQAKGKTPQALEVQSKIKKVLVPGHEGASAYSGEKNTETLHKGVLKIGKNQVELDAKNILAQSKDEVKQLRKDSSKETTISSLEACVKAEHSLGLYYSAIFQAKNPQAKTKAGKHLDSALKALKGIKPVKKGQLTEAQAAYLIQHLAIIQVLGSKSGSPITQQALLAELKQLAEKNNPEAVTKYIAKITPAEKATPSELRGQPKATDHEPQLQQAA